MTDKHHHGLEKLQVQLSLALVLAGVYFLAWPALAPDDPQGPLVLLASGQPVATAIFTALAVVLAVLVGSLTCRSQFEGSAGVLLAGLGGLCLRSQPLRNLLWYHQKDSGALFRLLMIELVVLAAAAVLALLVLALVRVIVARVVRLAVVRRGPGAQVEEPGPSLLACALGPWAGKADRRQWQQLGGCALVALGAAAVLVFVLMQSSDRGQVLFSLVAAFFVGGLAGHQLFPTNRGVAMLLLPVVMGCIFYLLGSSRPIGGEPQAWADIPAYSTALPIDWLCAGGGGLMLGLWLSGRINLAKQIQQAQKEP